MFDGIGGRQDKMARTSIADPFVPAAHDHRRCVHEAMERAVAVCEGRGVRLTELRRRVLELIWQSHAPAGAYQIMEMLAGERGRIAPPTVYRALEFLTREGLVHRIDSLNAYIGCRAPQAPHQAFFLICRHCGDAAEFHDDALAHQLARCVGQARFRIESATVELAGACASCTAKAGQA